VLRGVCTLVQNTFLLEVFARCREDTVWAWRREQAFYTGRRSPTAALAGPPHLQAGYHTPTTLPATLPTHCTPSHVRAVPHAHLSVACTRAPAAATHSTQRQC